MRTDEEIINCIKSVRHCDNCEDYHRCEEIGPVWKQKNPEKQRVEKFYVLQEIKRIQDFDIKLTKEDIDYLFSLETRKEVDRYRDKRIKERLEEI